MTPSHWLSISLLALPVSLMGCGSDTMPASRLQDRQRLSHALEAFNRANELTQPPPGQRSFEGTPEHDQQVLAALREGVAAADSVSDEFLDWLHPQMRSFFRDKYVAGQRLYLDGLLHQDAVEQTRGNELIQVWYTEFWEANNDAIADRAFGAPARFTRFLWFSLAWVIGIVAGAFFLIQPLIILLFAIPFTVRLKRLRVLKSNTPLLRYPISLVLLLALLLAATKGVQTWLHSYLAGYYIGVGITLLFGLAKLGANPANIQDYLETNSSYIDTEALKRAFPDAAA